jgi:hypothetical protein
MLKRLTVKICLWFADRHTACAALWNDLAVAALTGKSLTEIRRTAQQGEHDVRSDTR